LVKAVRNTDVLNIGLTQLTSLTVLPQGQAALCGEHIPVLYDGNLKVAVSYCQDAPVINLTVECTQAS